MTTDGDAIEALRRGEIRLDHDADYVKAQFTRQLMQHAWFIYHQDWDIRHHRRRQT